MRARLSFVLFAVSVSAFASQVVDPATALDQARKLIAEKKFDQATTVLTPAADGAAAITDELTRRKALAAVHFYSAVAWSGAGEEKKAKAHLTEFFSAAPDSRTIDPKKYDAKFVSLFNQMVPSDSGTFQQYYPAYTSFQTESHRAPEPGTFGNFPAMLLLASAGEKREWSRLLAEGDRQRFIDDFWKKRDTMPETEENEFRTSFERRVVYADKVFPAADGRGSMTDRGKVFVLLGEPALVRRRSINSRNSREQVWLAYENTMLNGTIEQWIYKREQLPVKVGQDQLLYRFVNQVGIGEYVLQQENAFAMQVLATAGQPVR